MSKKFLVVAHALVCAAVVLMVAVDRSWGQSGGGKGKEGPAAKTTTDDPFGEGNAPAVKKEAKPAAGDPGAAACVGPSVSAEQRIEKALDEPTSLEFADMPLSDVIQFLKEKHRIEIQLDRKALDDAGVGSDTPITRSLKGVSFRSALNLTLRDLDLTYTIRGEVLLITTPDAAEEMLLTRIYDVADLVTVRDERGQRWEDYDSLIDIVGFAVVPQSWDEVGGPGGIRGGSFGSAKVLVVSQTDMAHREIARLLEEIRKIAAKNPSDEPPLRHRPKSCHETPHAGAGAGMGGGAMGPSTHDKDKDKDNDRPAAGPKPNKPDKDDGDDKDDDDGDHDRENRGHHAGGGMGGGMF